MSPRPRSAASRSAAAKAAIKLPKERTQFVELLLANHFGTIPGSALKAKVAPKGNTTYEQLMCVGYNPQFKRLDAVVNIKQSAGYNGGLCTAGSQEYVKFFVSTDGGTTWSEKGTVSFSVWDVPGSKPLEYAASLYVDLDEECCKDENLVDVRAILSWQVPPGGPNDPIVWGNALDAKIQVEPIPSDTLLHLLECLEIKFPFEKASLLADLEQPVKFGTAKQLTALDLHKAYEKTKVPQHRYLFGHVQQFLAKPAQLTKTLSNPNFEPFPGLEKLVDISKLIGFILDPQGNETYEELGCVGFNENTTELVATIDVKLTSGYSGSLCTAGSQEFVNFWVDWGSGWQFVGTTSVNVHDIASIPSGGLRYSASLPFAQALAHRRPCDDGAVEARVRAVLSWATPPSTTDPYAVPVWGGHAETRIMLPPGYPITPGGGPHLESIGGMSPGDIGPSGLTLPGTTATSLGFIPDDSPFGGQIWFSGHIFNRFLPGVFGGPGIEYRIWIKTDGGWVKMNTHFTLKTWHYPAGIPVDVPVVPDINGWYPYLEDMTNPLSQVTVAQNTLGYWPSVGDDTAQIYMEARDTIGPLGSPTAVTLLQLDNTWPTGSVWITSGGGSCGDFKVGDTIDGAYTAADNEKLEGVSFSVEPSGNAITHVVTSPPDPLSQSGTWSLNTGTPAKMTPCGYVIRMDATDNTIVNSAWVGHDTPAFTGFCLKN